MLTNLDRYLFLHKTSYRSLKRQERCISGSDFNISFPAMYLPSSSFYYEMIPICRIMRKRL